MLAAKKGLFWQGKEYEMREAPEGGRYQPLSPDRVGRIHESALRVLEENAVMRIGESKLRPVNIRVLAVPLFIGV